MAAVCAKPGCGEPAEAWFVAAPRSQSVQLVAEAIDGGVALCADHVARFSVPIGWSIEDRRSRADSAVAPDAPPRGRRPRRPWFAPDTDNIDIDAGDAADTSIKSGRMLSRAFHGPPRPPSAVSTADELEARRLVRLGRVKREVDGVPQRPRDRVEDHGHDQSDSDADDDQEAHGDVGSAEYAANDDDHEHEPEGDDRVDAYGTDELPFPPLETDFARRAALG